MGTGPRARRAALTGLGLGVVGGAALGAFLGSDDEYWGPGAWAIVFGVLGAPVGALGGVYRPERVSAYSYADRVTVIDEAASAELKTIAGVALVGMPGLIDDDEPVIATGSVIRRGDKVAGPISTKLVTGPAADGEGHAYAVGEGGYLLGLGPEGECMRMRIDGLAPVRPTVTRGGDVFVATGWDIWKLARGAEKPPEMAAS